MAEDKGRRLILGDDLEQLTEADAKVLLAVALLLEVSALGTPTPTTAGCPAPTRSALSAARISGKSIYRGFMRQ